MRIAKKVQGALPIIGLVSRLASPEGGFDELVGCNLGIEEAGTAAAHMFRLTLDPWCTCIEEAQSCELVDRVMLGE
jgi:hypothetical protein